MQNKIKYFCYLAGFIESQPENSFGWRDEISKSLSCSELSIYCPIKYEAQKTGRPTGEHIKYVSGLKKGGKWEHFKEEMSKIWWGDVRPERMRYEVIQQFKYRSLIDGNRESDLKVFGDFEAVARSTFIILNYKKEIPTWGTPAEAIVAFFLDVPIYAISDVSKTEMNSSLLWWINETGGEVFYNLKECGKFIIEKYSLNIIKQ